MHFIDTVRRWVGSLAELGIAIIALGVVLGSVVGFVSELGDAGLVGLAALGILWWAYNKRA